MGSYEEELKGIVNYALQSVENEDIVNPNIEVIGNGIGDGYTSTIYFIKATGLSKNGEPRTIDLAFKRATRNAVYRKQIPILSCFIHETRFYEKVLPVFQKLQADKNISNPFDSVAKYYKSFINEDEEIIVLENLKENDYCLNNLKDSMNVEQIKLILDSYSKLHALSFALKEQNLEKFQELIQNYNECRQKVFGNNKTIDELFKNLKDQCIEILKKFQKFDLLEKYEPLNFVDLMMNPINFDTHSVIIHGDCWNNNYMFKYLNKDKHQPTKVSILDWQVSSVGSPIFDVSYFIFANWTSELDVDSLKDYYYERLSTFLTKLGSNPEQLFSRQTFDEHWNKYASVALIFTPLNIKQRYKNADPKTSQESGLMFSIENTSEYERVVVKFLQYMADHKLM